MASSCSFWAVSMIFITCLFSSPSSSSQIHVQFSTISAAPAFLPDVPPPLASAPALSPDISPLFPTPGGSTAAPSPAQDTLPTIPASPSPPNPDDTLAPGPNSALLPSETSVSPSSSASPALSPKTLASAFVFGLMAFCIMQLSWS